MTRRAVERLAAAVSSRRPGPRWGATQPLAARNSPRPFALPLRGRNWRPVRADGRTVDATWIAPVPAPSAPPRTCSVARRGSRSPRWSLEMRGLQGPAALMSARTSERIPELRLPRIPRLTAPAPGCSCDHGCRAGRSACDGSRALLLHALSSHAANVAASPEERQSERECRRATNRHSRVGAGSALFPRSRGYEGGPK